VQLNHADIQADIRLDIHVDICLNIRINIRKIMNVRTELSEQPLISTVNFALADIRNTVIQADILVDSGATDIARSAVYSIFVSARMIRHGYP